MAVHPLAKMAWRLACWVLSPMSGSGSFEKDSPVQIVAMEKEQKAGLVHEL